jgi:hypothetical protein
MTTIQITLPDDLAQEANTLGLLESGIIIKLLTDEIRQRKFDRILAIADQLAATGDVPMSEEEVQAEVDEYRAAKRAARA